MPSFQPAETDGGASRWNVHLAGPILAEACGDAE